MNLVYLCGGLYQNRDILFEVNRFFLHFLSENISILKSNSDGM